MRPLAVDLCCGLGGWSDGLAEAGFRVIGVDLKRYAGYCHEMIEADVRSLDGARFSGAVLIVASPPCEEFSRHDMPWTRAKNPPEPDLSIVDACRRIAREASTPLVMENVRGAQKWIGRADWNYRSCYLWGDGVPILRLSGPRSRRKERLGSKRKMERARVPFELAYWVGVYHLQGLKEVADGT